VHTGAPITEAFLLGASGGISFGYFSFAYEGYDPHVALLTRNTFDPFAKTLERIGATREVVKAGSPDKAVAKLAAALEEDEPAVVWADLYSLPYNNLPYDDGMWNVLPILVYAHPAAGTDGRVGIADRSAVPLSVSPEELSAARARVKKDRFQMDLLDLAATDRLPRAALEGLRECVSLYTEGPGGRLPKSSFGLAGLHHWARLLTNPKEKQSWAKVFPPGRSMYAGLVSAFGDVTSPVGLRCDDADRSLFADFLDEAAELLSAPVFREAAERFRDAAEGWRRFGGLLLPDGIAAFQEARGLLTEKARSFTERGAGALSDIRAADQRLSEIRSAMEEDFPLTDAEAHEVRTALANALMEIHDIEAEGVRLIGEALSTVKLD
jgi:hypothetical protein